jgi:hypothetical protein
MGWLLALVLKPLIAIAIAAAYYVVVIHGLRWLYPRLPKSRFVDLLFRERSDRVPDYGPTAGLPRQQSRATLEPPSR